MTKTVDKTPVNRTTFSIYTLDVDGVCRAIMDIGSKWNISYDLDVTKKWYHGKATIHVVVIGVSSNVGNFIPELIDKLSNNISAATKIGTMY